MRTMSTDVEISFIIPAFNAERVIDRALNSLIGFKNGDIEIILIDDGSTDNTYSICETYASRFRNIRCVHTDNCGVSSARNLGMSLARGEYVAFCDADDYLMKTGLDAMIQACRSKADFILFNNYQKNKSEISEHRVGIKQGLYTGDELFCVYKSALENKINVPWGKLYKRDVINRDGVRFPQNLSLGEDLVFNLEYLTKINTAYICSDFVYTYVRHHDGLSDAGLSMGRFEIYDRQFSYMKKFAYEVNFSDPSILYCTLLRIILNFCGKLRARGQTSKAIHNELCKYQWYSKVVEHVYRDPVDKVRVYILKNSLFLLASAFFHGE